jgi:hypothetical protein
MSAPGPHECLAAADRLLRGCDRTDGWWPRACACLIRLALEGGIDSYWQREAAAVAGTRAMRTKLLLLRRRTDKAVARRVAYAWSALSAATHHHCYELGVTAQELRRYHREVTALLELLEGPRAAR